MPHTQGRSTKTKDAVIGMYERNGEVRAEHTPAVNTKAIQKILDTNVEKASHLCVDEAIVYKGVKGDEKHTVNHSAGEFVNQTAGTNGIESVWAVLKRGHYGTFHHFSHKHLNRYINEFTFRLNQGNCKVGIMDRIKHLSEFSKGKRLKYKELINS